MFLFLEDANHFCYKYSYINLFRLEDLALESWKIQVKIPRSSFAPIMRQFGKNNHSLEGRTAEFRYLFRNFQQLVSENN